MERSTEYQDRFLIRKLILFGAGTVDFSFVSLNVPHTPLGSQAPILLSFRQAVWSALMIS